MLPLVPLFVGGLGAAALWRHLKNKMTPERRIVYETALKQVKDPAALRRLADAFEKEGLKNEANLLRKRAALRELPPETTKARRQAFKKGMSSKDPIAVNKLADAFEKEGATGAAAELRKYATSLAATPAATPAPEKTS